MKQFPQNTHLCNWIKMAREKVAFQGLPARICWLGYGERAKMGLAINEMVRNGDISAQSSLAAINWTADPSHRLTGDESMKDGSDVVADWRY